uniref:Uncharacterized protein n=1 Tax=Arundo donax TaxID=35708 RepID=A0A0A9E2X9_ARUDO
MQTTLWRPNCGVEVWLWFIVCEILVIYYHMKFLVLLSVTNLIGIIWSNVHRTIWRWTQR